MAFSFRTLTFNKHIKRRDLVYRDGMLHIYGNYGNILSIIQNDKIHNDRFIEKMSWLVEMLSQCTIWRVDRPPPAETSHTEVQWYLMCGISHIQIIRETYFWEILFLRNPIFGKSHFWDFFYWKILFLGNLIFGKSYF